VTLTLGELAEQIGAELHGDPSVVVHRVAALHDAAAGSVTFVSDPGYREQMAQTRASAVILHPSLLEQCTERAALVCADPYHAYALAAQALHPRAPALPGVHPTAVVAPQARVADGVSIGPHCVVEADAVLAQGVELGPGCVVGAGSSLGAETRLVARVTICAGVTVGARCLIQPGAVIGADGFGFAPHEGRWTKIPQLGGVRIGDDVEVGANTCIDRGALQDTVIADGVKLDNQIQVAHNVRIGAHTVMAGCVGIAGSARIGKACMIGGGVGIAGHLEVPDGVTVTGMSLVSKSLPGPGVYSSGLPAQPNTRWNRILARLIRIDELFRRVGLLDKRTK
jgi:UDP-3-O-[3-hydroxymyristoyl] glucosamine N-acyltransferase